MRSTKMRNLLVVNEQFLDEHNADIGHYGQTLINGFLIRSRGELRGLL
jgi:hypothetical protein